MNEQNAEPAAEQPREPHALAHVMPVHSLAAVWIGLVVLTIATVAAARMNLGGFNLWIALGIATMKATLVALYFMHLRYDRPFNAIVFVGLALMDTEAYRPELIPGYAPAMKGP